MPSSKSEYGALDFNLWKLIGREWLHESNINNQIQCSPDVGSLVDWRSGAVTCKIVAALKPGYCDNVIPTELKITKCGPSLLATSIVYILEASRHCHPHHDPCGLRIHPNLTNIPHPRGWVYLR